MNKSFSTPFELQKHVQSHKAGINNIITTTRAYLTFLEQTGIYPSEIIDKFRKVLIIKKKRIDFFVPNDEDVINNYNKIKDNPTYEIVYLVLATSGIRYIECLKFLKTYNINKFAKHKGYVSYEVSELRHTKNINKIYLPLFVYEKLIHVTRPYDSLRKAYRDKGCTFSLKYLRKWQYNFLIYNKVPESVADFIQGRVSRSIGATHYLAKSQQADYWYGEIVDKIEELFSY